MNPQDIFDFKLVDSFHGYNSANDKTKLRPGFLIRGSKNVYKRLSGTMASRPGLKRRGAASSTDAGIKSSYDWATSLGTVRPLRVCNNKLQVESDILVDGTPIWYDLLETSTLASPAASLTRFVFDSWWDDIEKVDTLLMVRGDNNILSWTGGMALFSSAALTTASGVTAVVAAPTAGGSGYAVGDLLLINSGGGNAQLRVDAVNAGAVTSVSLYLSGSGYTVGSGKITAAQTGSGINCTIEISTVGNVYSLTKTGTTTWAQSGFKVVTTQRSTGSLNSEKKIMINGAEFTYQGGTDTTTLSGVLGGDPTGTAANTVIIQSVIVSASKPVSGFIADFIRVVGNQAQVGSYTSRIVWQSSDSTVIATATAAAKIGYLNYTNVNGHVTGDPDFLVLDSLPTGIGEKDGRICVFAGNNELYLITPNTNVSVSFTGSDGEVRYVYNKVDKVLLPGLTSALAHEFIGNFEGNLVWLDQGNQLRALGTFTNLNATKPVMLSLPVQSELSEDDFTGGHLKVAEDTIYLTAPNTGRDWMYVSREVVRDDGSVASERFWNPPQIRGISRFATIEGVFYGHSNAHPEIFQIWDTGQWFDDGQPVDGEAEEIPYTWVMRFSYQNHARPQGKLDFDMAYYEGYMPGGGSILGRVYLDYQGASGTREIEMNTDDFAANLYTGNAPTSIGEETPGSEPYGDGIIEESGDQELVPKFRAIRNIPQPKSVYEYALELYSIEADSRFELSQIGVNAKLSPNVPSELRK